MFFDICILKKILRMAVSIEFHFWFALLLTRGITIDSFSLRLLLELVCFTCHP